MPGETIVEGIIYLLVQYVFSVIEYPGAFIHWQLRGRVGTFKNIVERWFGVNLLLSLILYGLITWCVIVLCY